MLREEKVTNEVTGVDSGRAWHTPWSFHLNSCYSVASEHPVEHDRRNKVICAAYQELLLTTKGSKEKFKQNYQNLNLSSCQSHLPTSTTGIGNENFIWCVSHLADISLW